MKGSRITQSENRITRRKLSLVKRSESHVLIEERESIGFHYLLGRKNNSAQLKESAVRSKETQHKSECDFQANARSGFLQARRRT